MAIQQHPVPQDISNYKFRLIGDMTIKQFAALGISIVLSVMTYSAPLPFFFKYPISFIVLLLGVGTAFVPFQGRTLDVWIVAFIKSIYSPTQYIWKHGQITPPVSTDNTSAPQTPIVSISAPATEEVTPTNTVDVPVTEEAVSPAPEQVVETTTISPTPTIQETIQTPTSAIQETPTITQPVTETSIIDNLQPATLDINSVTEPTVINIEPVIIKPETSTIDDPQTNISNLPIPFTPTTPNTLVGLTLNPNGQTLDGVLVEIKNQNITMRATKSNKLGQFLFVRPLENGLYQILAEKDGFQFESYSIQLNGEIINPLRIQATN